MDKRNTEQRKNKRRVQFDTRLKQLMHERNISQLDLRDLIYERFGELYGPDRISNMVNGHNVNCTVRSYLLVAEVLQVPVDDILEKEMVINHRYR